MIPDKPISINAKYKGRCRCGQHIMVGDPIYFDRRIDTKPLCQACADHYSEMGKKMLVRESPAIYSPNVSLTDCVKQLQLSANKPVIVELAILLRRLQTELLFTQEGEIFWLNFARITFPNAGLILSCNPHETICAYCRKTLAIGSRILYCKKSGKYLCLVCRADDSILE